MNITRVKALLALIPAGVLLVWSVAVFFKGRTLGWGDEHRVGHYLDLSNAILGLTLFPLGLVLRARTKPRQGRVLNSPD